MRSIAYALSPLPFPTLAGPGFKTYAAWPVWRDSARDEVRFAPLPKKEAARRWHMARRFDRQTHEPGKHGGAIGRTGLAVLYVLLFDFLDYATGRLEPSDEAIAAKAGVCRRAAINAVRCLRALGLLHWQRRCREDKDAAGRFRLAQETNAYAVLPPSHWRGYHEPPPAPPPEPGTWGDQAVREQRPVHPIFAIDEPMHRQSPEAPSLGILRQLRPRRNPSRPVQFPHRLAPQRPFFIANPGWVRSKAWIWLLID